MPASAILAIAGSVLFAGGAGLSLWRRRRLARALALAGKPGGALTDGVEVTLAGTLRAKDGVATHIPAGSESPVRAVLGATTERAHDAWIDVLGTKDRVWLADSVQVVVGTTERKHTAGGSVHELRDGDHVRARGRLLREARGAHEGETEKSYRQGAEAFRFDEAAKAPAVIIAAEGPRWAVPPWAVALAGVPLVGIGLWMRSMPSGHERGSGADACVAKVDELLRKNDLLALESARCDDPIAKARIAFARGDFANAHTSFEKARAVEASRTPTVPEIQSAAIAGDFASAKQLSIQLANAWYPGPTSTEKTRLLCVGDAYASRAAGARVGLLVKPNRDDVWCDYLAGDLEADHEARMWALQCDDDDIDTRRLLFLESGERGTYFTGVSGDRFYIEDYPLGALYDPAGWIAKRHIELEDAVAVQLDHGEIAFELLAQAALFRAVVGDAERAKFFLRQMAKPGGSRTPYILGAIAAFYANDADLADTLLDLGHDDANAVGVMRRTVMPLLRGPGRAAVGGEPWNAAIDAAIHEHDATAVAAAFAKDGKTHRYEAARVRASFTPAELAPLRDWLRTGFPAPNWDHGLFAAGLGLGDELALAEAFDDKELAELLRPRVAAFTKAMTSRPTSSRMSDPSFANDLVERTQDKPPDVWRWHH